MSNRLKIYVHQSYSDVLNNNSSYSTKLLDELEKALNGIITYKTFQILAYIAIKRYIDSRSSIKCSGSVILVPGNFSDRSLETMQKSANFRNYNNTHDLFVSDVDPCHTIQLVALLKTMRGPIFLLSPILFNDNKGCIGLIITDCKNRKSCWEPHTTASESIPNLRTIYVHENEGDETPVFQFRQKGIQLQYLFNNHISAYTVQHTYDNLFLSCPRFMVDQFTIKKVLPSCDSYSRYFILPFIIYSFLDNLTNERNIPQDGNDISKNLKKLFRSRNRKNDLVEFASSTLKQYDLLRQEKKQNGDDSDIIKFYPIFVRIIQKVIGDRHVLCDNKRSKKRTVIA